MGWFNRTKKKAPKKLHFAVVITDQDPGGLQIMADKDQTIEIVTGEVEVHEIIPQSTLKALVSRYRKTYEAAGVATAPTYSEEKPQ